MFPILTALSCKKEKTNYPVIAEPVACFETEHRMLKVGERFSLSNCSANFTLATWSFGDENYSKELSPSHVYDSAGVYLIQLTVAQGTTNATASKQVVAGKNSELTLKTRLSRWQYPQGYSSVRLEGLLEREQMQGIHYYDGARSSTTIDTLKSADYHFIITDDLSTFRIKIFVYGVNGFTSDKLDSLIIDKIHAVDGKKDSIGVLNSKFARMNYTIQPLVFK